MEKEKIEYLSLIYDLICIDLQYGVKDYYKFPYEFAWLVFGPKINIE